MDSILNNNHIDVINCIRCSTNMTYMYKGSLYFCKHCREFYACKIVKPLRIKGLRKIKYLGSL